MKETYEKIITIIFELLVILASSVPKTSEYMQFITS